MEINKTAIKISFYKNVNKRAENHFPRARQVLLQMENTKNDS